MKFPVPKTLPGAFSPLLLITWALGIGVIEYPIGRPRPIISAFLSIVNFSIFLGFVRMANLSELETFDRSKTAADGRRLNSYIATTLIAGFMCITKINAKVVNGVFPKLIGINARLNRLGISNGYEYIFKIQIIQLGIAFSLLFVIIGLDFQYVGFEFANEFSRFGFLSSLHYSIWFVFIVDYSFGSTVRYLGNRFKCLNQVLAEVNFVERAEPRVTRRKKNQFAHFPWVISEIHRYDSIVSRATDQRWLLCVIRETRNLHRGLFKVATELNRVCGMQVLLSLAWTFEVFISILHVGYNIVLASFKHRTLPDHWMHVFNNIMWNSFFALKLFLIVDSCETTSCEANRTGELISKLRDDPAADEEFRDEINTFSLQLIQNPLEFSANGFFTLNYSLIRGMMGAVTTYLIIIIQMQSIYEPESVASTKNSTILLQTNNSNQN